MMNKSRNAILKEQIGNFLPAVSIDVVIFGFHENELRILLLKMKGKEESWSLPGGFVYKEECLEEAAKRVLLERTELKDIFLEQFHVFSDPGRTQKNNRAQLLEEQIENDEFAPEIRQWLLGRFITVGFYALVEYTKVKPMHDFLSVECSWCEVQSLPFLVSDHREIIEKALQTLRLHLNFRPLGMNLLPREFTMPELQRLYETILDTTLDRRNFQRKILSYQILKRLPVKRAGGAYKAPYLYSFDEVNYQQALKNGLKDLWFKGLSNVAFLGATS